MAAVGRRHRRPPRRWWQHGFRILAAGGCLLIVAYAALPLWFPEDHLARWLQRDLSKQVGAAVTVRDLSLSWQRGIVIGQISVADSTDPSGLPILTAGPVRVEFSPLRMALFHRTGWMEIESARVRLKADDAWKWNLAEVRLPSVTLLVDRTRVSRAVATLEFPHRPRPWVLEIGDLQVTAGAGLPVQHLTMSAILSHGQERSPLALKASLPGGQDNPMLEFSFGSLDLGEFGLIDALDMPLRRLDGLCSGSANLPVVQGRITGGDLDVRIENLDIQPVDGPDLPLIPQAGISVDVDVDLPTGMVDLKDLKVRGPGIVLEGDTRFHAALLGGRWLAVKHLDIRWGAVEPVVLERLLLGGVERPIGVPEVDGVVKFAFELDHDPTERALSADIDLDATGAGIARNGRVLKPKGRPCVANLRGRTRTQTWQVDIEKLDLRLGANRVSGQGMLGNALQFWADWTDPDPDEPLLRLGEHAAELSGQCEWRVTELESLRSLSPMLSEALAPVLLEGELTGRWGISREIGSRLEAHCFCPVGTSLRYGDAFAKPTDQPMLARFVLDYDRQARRVREAGVRFTCGPAEVEVQLDEASVRVSGADEMPAQLVGRGSWNVAGVEDLLSMWRPSRTWKAELRGRAGGEITVSADRKEGVGLAGTAELTELGFVAREFFHKPQGESARMDWSIRWRQDAPALDLAMDGRTEGGRAKMDATVLSDSVSLRADVSITDVEWLCEHAPSLAALTKEMDLRGAADVSAELDGREDLMTGRAAIEATDLHVLLPGGGRKEPGTSFQASAEVALRRLRSGGVAGIDVPTWTVLLDESKAGGSLMLEGVDSPETAIVEASAKYTLAIDEGLRAASPALARMAEEWGMGGVVHGALHVAGNANEVDFRGELVADDLSVRMQIGRPEAGEPSPAVASVEKPACLNANASFEMTLLPHDRRLSVRRLDAAVGPLRLMADARLTLGSGEPVGGESLTAIKSNFRLWAQEEDGPGILTPGLPVQIVSGGFSLDGQLSTQAAGATLAYASIRVDELKLDAEGVGVLLDGSIDLTDLKWGDDYSLASLACPSLRIKTEGLDAWMTADLQDLQMAANTPRILRLPTGDAAIAAAVVDVPELEQTWQRFAKSRSPVDPSGPVPDVREARRRARQWVVNLERMLEGTNLAISFEADRVLGFPDEISDLRCDANSVAGRGTAAGGQLRLSYAAGVSGGTVRETIRADLSREQPMLQTETEVRDMQASEFLQPQIAAQFPGNILHGSMWTRRELSVPLVHALAETLNPQARAYPVGEGVTRLLDGVTEGRAAPHFVTRLLPGLNLVEYEYDEMVGFATYEEDGAVLNDMVFSGKRYDMYIEGLTNAEGRAEYEVGVILLGTPQTPAMNHQLKLGRIPILKFRARIEDGRKLDEQVTYPWPNEAAFSMFVRNNLFYRLWLERQRQPSPATPGP